MSDKLTKKFQPYVKLVLAVGASIWFLLGTFATVDYVNKAKADVREEARAENQQLRELNLQLKELVMDVKRTVEKIDERTWQMNHGLPKSGKF